MQNFKEGDKVTWTSSAGSYTKTKVGTVVVVIPANVYPDRVIKTAIERYQCKSAWGRGWLRPHESYLVLVPHPGKGKPTLYWPRVKNLKKVDA